MPLILLNSISGNAQKLQLDFGAGIHLTKIKFHHNSPIDSDSDDEYTFRNSSNLTFGISSPIIKEKLNLRSEIGFINTNVFLSMRYDYMESSNSGTISRITYLNNQKLYFAILPEYKLNIDVFSFTFNAGPLISIDVSNTMSSINTILRPKSIPDGFKLGAGLQFVQNNLGAFLRLSYTNVGKSELQNIYHPKISYSYILWNIGVIYSI